MIYAHEARVIAQEFIQRQDEAVDEQIKSYLPFIEQKIRETAQHGKTETKFTRDEVLEKIQSEFYSKDSIMDTLITKLRNFGYTAWTGNGGWCIHVRW